MMSFLQPLQAFDCAVEPLRVASRAAARSNRVAEWPTVTIVPKSFRQGCFTHLTQQHLPVPTSPLFSLHPHRYGIIQTSV